MDDVVSFTITKRAIDSRKKREMIYFVYTVQVEIDGEEKVIKNEAVQGNMSHHRIEIKEPYTYTVSRVPAANKKNRPIVVGTGPCGLFASLLLAEAGLNPLVIERGSDVDTRVKDVKNFIATGELNPSSNIQFGEGGAGTFSDGKLNTLITSPHINYIFNEFVQAGAPENILWDAKPHVGTDNIRIVAKNLRKKIVELGGEVRFNSQLTDVLITKNQITGIIVNDNEVIPTDTLVLAIGYSARETYALLHNRALNIEQKLFSIGVRIEHKAAMINRSQYDSFYTHEKLGAAPYKLVSHSEKTRTVYTFCMCPGGFVVPATTQEGHINTNGMSEYAQDGENSNSALLVNIKQEDFESDHPLAGIAFQEKWEKQAFEVGGGNFHAPIQLVGDFLRHQASNSIRSVEPTYKPGFTLTSLDTCLPEFVSTSLREALPKLDNKIHGFAHPDAVLTAVETRSSAPVRITRNPETLESNIRGIYPAGEGAGYAGGIVSSAVDGIRVSEAIVGKYSG